MLDELDGTPNQPLNFPPAQSSRGATSSYQDDYPYSTYEKTAFAIYRHGDDGFPYHWHYLGGVRKWLTAPRANSPLF